MVSVVVGGGTDDVMNSMCEISLQPGPEPLRVTVTLLVPIPLTV
jgi:hypothetical protein